MSRPSASDAVAKAWQRMLEVCLRPFDAGKWFRLGFCAWLAGLADASFQINLPDEMVSDALDHAAPRQALRWLEGDGDQSLSQRLADLMRDDGARLLSDHASVAAIGVFALIALALGIFALVAWLASRGTFMFVDGLAHNRGAVKEPWKKYRALGNSLFTVRLVLALVFGAALLAVVGLALGMVWTELRTEHPRDAVILLKLIGPLIGMVAIALAAALISAVLHNLVVPVMYARDLTVLAAWGYCRSHVIDGHLSEIIIFFLIKIALLIGAAVVAVAAACVTCCIAALPYLGTVILLPLPVLLWAYPLHFIQQFDPELQIFHRPSAAEPR